MVHPVKEIGQGDGDGVDVEPALRESVTESSSEASWREASANQRIGTSSEAFRAGPRARRRIGTSSKVSGEAESWCLVRGLAAWASGESENRPRPTWLSLGFDIYKV